MLMFLDNIGSGSLSICARHYFSCFGSKLPILRNWMANRPRTIKPIGHVQLGHVQSGRRLCVDRGIEFNERSLFNSIFNVLQHILNINEASSTKGEKKNLLSPDCSRWNAKHAVYISTPAITPTDVIHGARMEESTCNREPRAAATVCISDD